MINLYVTTSSLSCRKARTWLDNYQIPYIERDIEVYPLSAEELKAILRLTELGTEEIISHRSSTYLNLFNDSTIEDLSLKKLLDIMCEHPKLIRKPIVMDEKRLVVGYNEDELRCFLPREARLVNLRKMKNTSYTDKT